MVLAGEGEAMPAGAEAIAFSAQTRVSGLKIGDREVVKGAVDAVLRRLPVCLVRDGTGQWRSGKLDEVLAGDFDLLMERSAPTAA